VPLRGPGEGHSPRRAAADAALAPWPIVATETSKCPAGRARAPSGRNPLARRVARMVGQADPPGRRRTGTVGRGRSGPLVREVGVGGVDMPTPFARHISPIRAYAVGATRHRAGPERSQWPPPPPLGQFPPLGPRCSAARCRPRCELQQVGPSSTRARGQNPADLVGPVGHPAKVGVSGRQVQARSQSPSIAGDGDLRAVGQGSAAPGDGPSLDLVADHDVQPRLAEAPAEEARSCTRSSRAASWRCAS